MIDNTITNRPYPPYSVGDSNERNKRVADIPYIIEYIVLNKTAVRL
jgi:hypothetical protein